jgi:flagellar motor component MotA
MYLAHMFGMAESNTVITPVMKKVEKQSSQTTKIYSAIMYLNTGTAFLVGVMLLEEK